MGDVDIVSANVCTSDYLELEPGDVRWELRGAGGTMTERLELGFQFDSVRDAVAFARRAIQAVDLPPIYRDSVEVLPSVPSCTGLGDSALRVVRAFMLQATDQSGRSAVGPLIGVLRIDVTPVAIRHTPKLDGWSREDVMRAAGALIAREIAEW